MPAPTADLHCATKKYVDDLYTAQTSVSATWGGCFTSASQTVYFRKYGRNVFLWSDALSATTTSNAASLTGVVVPAACRPPANVSRMVMAMVGTTMMYCTLQIYSTGELYLYYQQLSYFPTTTAVFTRFDTSYEVA